MKIKHYDLFAGIGGFSLALERVFDDATIEHVFCEWESFPTAVLKKHWQDAEFFGDIAELVAHTKKQGTESGEDGIAILTGGFPCQPFSAAGRRRGTADDRYQWPNMLAVIRNTKPDWVIAENVRGLVTWNDGMVLEQVCTDLESEGYEVQPLIIPAVAVNAPHRRDRVWIIAHRNDTRNRTSENDNERSGSTQSGKGQDLAQRRTSRQSTPSSHAGPQRRESRSNKSIRSEGEEPKLANDERRSWERDWREVALATCNDGMDDGLSRFVDGVSHSRAKWRKESLKAYGNAIVPQVAVEIFKGIKLACLTK